MALTFVFPPTVRHTVTSARYSSRHRPTDQLLLASRSTARLRNTRQPHRLSPRDASDKLAVLTVNPIS